MAEGEFHLFCFINIKNFMILIYCNLLFNLIVLVSDFYFFWSSMTILFNLVNGQQNLKFRVNLSRSFIPIVVSVLSTSGILLHAAILPRQDHG